MPAKKKEKKKTKKAAPGKGKTPKKDAKPVKKIALKQARKQKEKHEEKTNKVTSKLAEKNAAYSKIESLLIKEPSFERFQVLSEDGKCNEKLLHPDLYKENIIKAYESMIRARLLDVKMLAMQRTGRLYTFATIYGQEASNVGSALALEKDDWAIPAFRETAVMIERGVKMSQVLQIWGGDERGHRFDDGVNVFPVAIPVGTQALHGVGAAMAATIKKEKGKAFITYFGDGATSEGDVNEAINFAGVFQAPIVLFCQNNQWAISVPREKQSRAKSLAQKGLLGGMECLQVDGNDLFAVYAATKYALDKARNGGGPTFIESYTYRLGDHTTADDASKYRGDKEVDKWKERDPIDRVRKYLKKKKWWDDDKEDALIERLEKDVESAVKEFEDIEPQDPLEIFNHVYAEKTHELREQEGLLKEYMKAEIQRKKEEREARRNA